MYIEMHTQFEPATLVYVYSIDDKNYNNYLYNCNMHQSGQWLNIIYSFYQKASHKYFCWFTSYITFYSRYIYSLYEIRNSNQSLILLAFNNYANYFK